MKTQTLHFTKNTLFFTNGSVSCIRYGRTPDEGLICLPAIQHIFGETPDKITIKVSPTRIHSKGCHKVERRRNECDSWRGYPFIDGVALTGGMVWHWDLSQAIDSLGFGNTFYIIVTAAKA